jgi:hypothetical protein
MNKKTLHLEENGGIAFSENINYYQKKLSDDDLAPIWREVEKIQSNYSKALPVNSTLAGNIKKEYMLVDCFKHVENCVLPLLNEIKENFVGYFHLMENEELALNKLWVNFQKKYEFNPFHTHKGIYSFVLWLNVPYDIEDEKNHESVKYSNSPSAGHFSFFYVDGLGQMQMKLIPVDKKYNGTLAIFSSETPHCVWPFYTSDEYRISVSGNINIKLRKSEIDYE